MRRFAIDYFVNSQTVRFIDAKYGGLDPEYLELFTAFVDDLQSQGVEVFFYLPPVHPDAYKLLLTNANYYVLTATDKFIRGLAETRGIKVLGALDPKEAGLGEGDFVDGNHCTRAAMAKIFTPSSLRP